MLETLLSGILGAIIGGILSFLTLRYNYKDLYARNISTSRMDWINSFREDMATVIAALKCGEGALKNQEKNAKFLFEAEKARARLLTRINMNISRNGNEYNKVISDILLNIDFINPGQETKEQINSLMYLSRRILEIEWKRVKNEAGGKEK